MPPCILLPWDSEFFGFRIGRVEGHTLNPQQAEAIDAWCHQQAVRCLYFLASANDPQTSAAAEDAGYHLVDVRMTFKQKLLDARSSDGLSTGLVIRPARPKDIPALREIGRVSYTLSRFYFDQGFARQRCDELYALWVEKSCQGYADEVLVAEVEGQPGGFITLKTILEGEPHGEIGLVGISSQAQGRGLGPRLVEYGLAWFASQGLPAAEVVTQGRNLRAQRLYQRAGFVTEMVRLWYHKWFSVEKV